MTNYIVVVDRKTRKELYIGKWSKALRELQRNHKAGTLELFLFEKKKEMETFLNIVKVNILPECANYIGNDYWVGASGQRYRVVG